MTLGPPFRVREIVTQSTIAERLAKVCDVAVEVRKSGLHIAEVVAPDLKLPNFLDPFIIVGASPSLSRPRHTRSHRSSSAA